MTTIDLIAARMSLVAKKNPFYSKHASHHVHAHTNTMTTIDSIAACMSVLWSQKEANLTRKHVSHLFTHTQTLDSHDDPY
jgi:hypothetical protein